MNILKKLLSYTNSKHNILAIVFVLVIILVAQHPNLFSQPVNSTIGKLLVLLIILLLTNYNIIVGLIATILFISLHIYLHESGFEGFENAVPDSKPIAHVDSTGKKSVPSKLDDTDDSKPTEVAKTVSNPSIPSKPSMPKPPVTAHATKLINASNVTKPMNSKQIPATKTSNKDVVAHSPNTGTLNPSIA
jgi:hypothetical protein